VTEATNVNVEQLTAVERVRSGPDGSGNPGDSGDAFSLILQAALGADGQEVAPEEAAELFGEKAAPGKEGHAGSLDDKLLQLLQEAAEAGLAELREESGASFPGEIEQLTRELKELMEKLKEILPRLNLQEREELLQLVQAAIDPLDMQQLKQGLVEFLEGRQANNPQPGAEPLPLERAFPGLEEQLSKVKDTLSGWKEAGDTGRVEEKLSLLKQELVELKAAVENSGARVQPELAERLRALEQELASLESREAGKVDLGELRRMLHEIRELRLTLEERAHRSGEKPEAWKSRTAGITAEKPSSEAGSSQQASEIQEIREKARLLEKELSHLNRSAEKSQSPTRENPAEQKQSASWKENLQRMARSFQEGRGSGEKQFSLTDAVRLDGGSTEKGFLAQSRVQQAAAGKGEMHPSLQESILEQLQGKLSYFKGTDKFPAEMRLSLRPPSLGEVTARVMQHQGRLTAEIVAESTSVKELLENNLAGLKERFHQMNLNVERVEVYAAAEEFNGQDGEHRRDDFSREHRQGSFAEAFSLDGTARESSPEEEANPENTRGGVELWA